MVGENHLCRKPPYMVNIEDDYSVFQNLGLMDFVCDIFSKIVFWLIPTIAWGLNSGYQGELRNPKSGLLGFRAHRYCTLLQKRSLLCWPLLSPRYNPAPSKTSRFLLTRWENLPSGQQNSCWHGKPMYYRYQQQEKERKKTSKRCFPPKKSRASKATNKNPKNRHFFHVKTKSAKKPHGENPKENKKHQPKITCAKKVPDFKTGTELAKAKGRLPISKPPANGGGIGEK